MRKFAANSIIVLFIAGVFLAMAGCHDGYRSRGFGYGPNPACRPVYDDCDGPRYHGGYSYEGGGHYHGNRY